MVFFREFSDHICHKKNSARYNDGRWTYPTYPSDPVRDTLNEKTKGTYRATIF